MYPVTCDGTNRIATKDVMLGKHFVPRGTTVWLPFAAMFNSPHNFPQPDQYMPVMRQSSCSRSPLLPVNSGTSLGPGLVLFPVRRLWGLTTTMDGF